jgi:RimJ/RimL family protein N-acetyltransferase
MELQFGNYFIRDLSQNDVDSLVKYANNYSISRFLRNTFPYPYTKDDADRWINFVKNDKYNLSFAIADKDELIGGIGAMSNQDVNRFTVEIGYWLAEPFWNKGITTTAVKTFCKYLFDNYNFNHLTASIFEGNDASMKVVKKVGFVLEGVLRKDVFKENKFLDQYIYGLLKEEFKL